MAGIIKIEIDDQSDINQVVDPTTTNVDRPIIMAASSADKGPEEWVTVIGDSFYDYFGKTPSFYRHGQPLIQAANAIEAGAYLRFRRVVANDATLANIGVVANVKNVKKQKTDSNGVPLYIDATTGKETTDSVGNTPILKNHVEISYQLVSVVLDGNNINSFAAAFLSDYMHQNNLGEDDHYPLFFIGDIGRGKSNKRFRIYLNDNNSYPIDYARYIIEVIENDEVLEKINFTMDPDVIEKDINQSLSNVIKMKSKQIRAHFFEDEFQAFVNNVSYLIGGGIEDQNQFEKNDVLFGTDEYGKAYPDITVTNEVDLSTIYGIQLLNGSNGEFGDRPVAAETYAVQLKKAFDGSLPNGDDIYDLDNNRIDAIFDANYPSVVKRAIEQLVNFREDCIYFRDMGTGITSIDELKIRDLDNDHSRFSASYMNSYDIYEPYTKKQITVTIMYDLVRLFVKHFINGRTRPFCGLKYDVVIPSTSIIDGTLNFTPKNTPSLNQKQDLETLRINYACYYNNVLTLDSNWTSQTRYTQLSWICNVMAVQEVIKAIRLICPKIRYTFIDGDSEEFTKYKQDIQNEVIDKYASKFKAIQIEFLSDDQYVLNKLIYAHISVVFRNWVEKEYFKITALNTIQ